MAHVEQLPDGTWRARYRRPNGRVASQSGFLNRTEAARWGADQEAMIRRSLWIDPRDGDTQFGQFAHDWLSALRPRLQASTVAKYECYLANQILPQWRSWNLSTIFNSYVEIEAWVSQLHTDYAQQTVSSIFSVFSSILSAAARARMIPANPSSGVRVAGQQQACDRLIATPVQALRAAMRVADLGLGLRGFTLCVLNLYTGARWSELVGQQRHEYDPVRKAITIRHPLRETAGKVSKPSQEGGAGPDTSRVRRRRRKTTTATKTPAGARTVVLAPSIAELYERALDSHDHEFVLCTARGRPWRRSNFTQRYWRPAWDGSDGDWQPLLPEFTFHEGRHTHASWLAEDGIPEVARRARLGQKMAGIARVYDHVTPEMEHQVCQTLQARWNHALTVINDTERRWLTERYPWLTLPRDGEARARSPHFHPIGPAD